MKDTSFLPMLEEARSNVQLYGQTDEIALLEAFIENLENSEIEGVNNALGKLIPLIRQNVRKELNI